MKRLEKWYNSGNAALKEVALQAFKEEELKEGFKDIKTFHDACNALEINYENAFYTAENISKYSRASAAMFKLSIIRKSLNLGQDLHLTKNPKDSYIYYPHNPFITTDSTFYKSDIKSGAMEIIGKIKSEGTMYYVLGGGTFFGGYAFYGCSGLTSITYNGTMAQWKTITRYSNWHSSVPSTTTVTCSDGTCGLDDK